MKNKEIFMNIRSIFKRKKLFGNNVEPRCEYCRFIMTNRDGSVSCAYKSETADSPCQRYVYDPLKREPRTAPSLPSFTPDDFKL